MGKGLIDVFLLLKKKLSWQLRAALKPFFAINIREAQKAMRRLGAMARHGRA
ncbi:hypothetical protein [Ottowia sp.]|uniref:hypothetical protein n=1 Tax=Ottowia sp. TaxID=1898956 RepID=UPI003A8905DC